MAKRLHSNIMSKRPVTLEDITVYNYYTRIFLKSISITCLHINWCKYNGISIPLKLTKDTSWCDPAW